MYNFNRFPSKDYGLWNSSNEKKKYFFTCEKDLNFSWNFPKPKTKF